MMVLIRTMPLVTCLLALGIFSGFGNLGTLPSESGFQSGRLTAPRDVWESLYNLDPIGALRHPSLEIRLFAAALRMILDGKPENSQPVFQKLARSTDYRIRANAALLLANMAPFDGHLPVQERIRSNVPEAPSVPIAIPFRTGKHHSPLFSVSINGGSCRMILDTGSTYSVIDDVTARRWGVRLLGTEVMAVTISGKQIPMQPAIADELRIGGLAFGRHPVMVIQKRNLIFRDRRRTFGVDGAIGWNTLRHFRIAIDMRRMRIVLAASEKGNNGERNLFWLGFPVIRTRRVGGGWMHFGLDTGAGGSYLTPTGMRRLPNLRVYQRRIRLSPVGERLNFIGSIVSELTLTLREQPFRLLNLFVMPADYGTFARLDGIIGFDAALENRLVFDAEAGQFILEPYTN